LIKFLFLGRYNFRLLTYLVINGKWVLIENDEVDMKFVISKRAYEETARKISPEFME